jgi:hypothetical protein
MKIAQRVETDREIEFASSLGWVGGGFLASFGVSSLRGDDSGCCDTREEVDKWWPVGWRADKTCSHRVTLPDCAKMSTGSDFTLLGH